MRGRAVRNPVAKATPAGILASLYNCLPDGFLGATGGGDQARVEMRTEVCACILGEEGRREACSGCACSVCRRM